MKFWVMFSILLCNALLVFSQSRWTNSIGMEFKLIEPGTMIVGAFQPPYPTPQDTIKSINHEYIMWMGDGRSYNTTEFDLAKTMALNDGSKGFQVELKERYYIGVTEVTQGQWKSIMGNNPSQFQDEPEADSLPVENVSWKDAQRFVKKLNRKEKGNRYRLPTEFEWEYAARAGEKNDILWKDIEASANLNKKRTAIVKSKQPNAWGLYDMLGNVWEWVDDIYNEKLFADPTPPKKGKVHVLKGASFTGDVKNATYMTHAAGPGNGWDVGFRIVKIVDVENE